ncbi:MAG TPA: Gfo/Idh/MocA family oxidoreductase [Chitinophagaceae bacterium]|nr:Gfo/Idh/MocA family oxidoreductase [Chitinophagaceae bacterium]
MDIRFALIGCGRVAERHAEYMQANGKLVAVCDVIKERSDKFSLRFGATPYYTIDHFLQNEKVDVVAICTPNGLHAQQSISILEAGMHVLCEKPMAISVADCREMIDASERSGKILFVVKQNRFNPPITAVKRIMDEGRLGKIYSLQLNCFWNRDADYYQDSWHGTLAMDGGTLFTQFSHFIDLLYWMFGEVEDVKALLRNYAHRGIIEFEDTGMVILEFKNGITGTINYTVNSHNTNMEGSITIFGEKGTVKVGGQYLNRIEYQDIENYIIEDLPAKQKANDYGSYQGSMSNHDKVYENLVNFLHRKEPVYISPMDGMKTVEIIEMIYRKSEWVS